MNTVYYNKIRTGPPGSCSQISPSVARNLYIFNLILAIIAALMWIITLVRLFLKPQARTALTAQAKIQAQQLQQQAIAQAQRAQQAVTQGYQTYLAGPQLGFGYAPPAYPTAQPIVSPGIQQLGGAVSPLPS